jgi:Tol biopolymer transport system component
MDADGNFIRKVGEFGGSPTWSPDGKFIAVGCEKEICILDFATMPDMRNNLGMRSNSPKSAYRLPAPDRCEEKVNYGHGELYSGILSMSWSPSGKKLAVVCGSEDPKEVRSVCILSLDGGTECWDESLSQDIYRAVWSPMDENVIAIAGPSVAENTSEITLVNARGQNPIQLARGWSPEWSPDGKQIAYAQMTQEHLGIAIINRDGTGFRWANHAIQNFDYDCRRFTGTCRLSWSPDGRYIVFTSPWFMGIGLELYRIDLQTEKIIRLVDDTYFRYPAEPDWGP